MLCLTVADAGPGLPEGFDLDRQTTVGLSTVRLLAKNLGGSVTARNEHGAVLSVQFPG
jgi:two-component sensor histidine kinase